MNKTISVTDIKGFKRCISHKFPEKFNKKNGKIISSTAEHLIRILKVFYTAPCPIFPNAWPKLLNHHINRAVAMDYLHLWINRVGGGVFAVRQYDGCCEQNKNIAPIFIIMKKTCHPPQ